MQNSLWKLTALTAVMGLGILVVYQAQQGLGDAGTTAGDADNADNVASTEGNQNPGQGAGNSGPDSGSNAEQFLAGNSEPPVSDLGADSPFRSQGAGTAQSNDQFRTEISAADDPFRSRPASSELQRSETDIEEFRPIGPEGTEDSSVLRLTSGEDEPDATGSRNQPIPTNDGSSSTEPDMLPLLGSNDRDAVDDNSRAIGSSPQGVSDSSTQQSAARARVQRMLATARRAIAAGDLDVAQELAEAASEIPVTYAALDDRPEEVLRDIERQLALNPRSEPAETTETGALPTIESGEPSGALPLLTSDPDPATEGVPDSQPQDASLVESPFNVEPEAGAASAESGVFEPEPDKTASGTTEPASELVDPFASEPALKSEPDARLATDPLPIGNDPESDIGTTGDAKLPFAVNEIDSETDQDTSELNVNEPGLSNRDPLVPGAEPLNDPPFNESTLNEPLPDTRPESPVTGSLPEPATSTAPIADAIPLNDLSHKRPELTIEKVAPKEAVLNKDMIYSILITNRGATNATEVVVEDRVPKGCELVGTIPQAELVDDKLIWKLDRLEAGKEKKILVKVTPKEAGEIGSVATVSFVSEFSSKAKTDVRPSKSPLKVTVQSPDQAQLGETVTMKFRIENSSPDDLTGLAVQDLIPAGFEHPAGDDLTYDVGKLAAGEVLDDVELELKAVKAGTHVNRIILKADGGIRHEVKTPVKITEQGLQVQLAPMPASLVGQRVDQTTTILNRSATDRTAVGVISRLPAEVAFVTASGGGKYNASAHAVVWNINQIPARGKVSLTTTVQTKTFGDHQALIQITEPGRQPLQATATIETRGIAVLAIDLNNVPPTVSTGQEFTVDARILNRGTGPDSKVQLSLDLPQEIEFVNSRGPVRMAPASVQLVDGQAQKRPAIQSAVIPEVGERASVEFQITLRARQGGRPKLRAKVSSAQSIDAITTEAAVVVIDAR